MHIMPTLYRALTDLGSPLINAYLRHRLKKGREDPTRFPERHGAPGLPRPSGKLIWCHAASVGEALSLLALINKLHETTPDLAILVTTGTVTSATLMAKRLPSGALHQYIPVDRAPWVERFLDFWKPDLAIWVESELWPNMLSAISNRKIPAILLNARMSEKSFEYWHRFAPEWCREMLSTFPLILAQTERDAQRLSALKAIRVQCLGNLKFAAATPSCNEQELEHLRQQIGHRPVWLIASTHPGEEELALAAHKAIKKNHPEILTIIVPRHPTRRAEIASLITNEQKLCLAQRSKKDPISSDTDIYLGDTLGELGLIYSLSPITVIGGSLLPKLGGHNPIEAAQLGAAIILGPYMRNFEEITKSFLACRAAIQLASAKDLPQKIEDLLANPRERQSLAHAAQQLARSQQKTLDNILTALQPWLNRAQ
ncbi:MAG: 3-deoxy-D-manno-octulosonic acid transferase [Bdellovibrionales bacterium]